MQFAKSRIASRAKITTDLNAEALVMSGETHNQRLELAGAELDVVVADDR